MAQDFTTNVISPLHVDRTPACGNSEGDDGRGRLHVKVNNKDSEPIPVTITDSEPGEPFYEDFSGVPSGVGPHDLIDFTVAASTKRFLAHLEVSCRIESVVQVTKNGTVIGTSRTGAAVPTAKFDWNPRRECVAGDNIKVTLTKRAGGPDNNVAAHLMGLEKPTT